MTQLILVVILSVPALPLTAAELRLNISGVKTAQGGTILAGLYNSEDGFPDDGHQIAGIGIPVNGETVTGSFIDLPAGRYAVALFHDADNDGKMDTGLFGIPREGYGFSGPEKAPMRPPSFSAGSVELKSGDTITTDITMKYF